MKTSTSNISHPHAVRRARRQAGATLVEFALVMPLALLLVMGIIQIGLMFTAKQVLNQAAFMAGRAGAVNNAQQTSMEDALTKALLPFYQDTTIGNDFARLSLALLRAKQDVALGFVHVEKLSPTPDAFADFGITSGASGGHKYIPNDNLEFRSHTAGANSGLSLQDANTLKIKVTYGYELKVPLMQSVVKSVMCGFDTGVDAFGRGTETAHAGTNACQDYYNKGRIPLVTYATVQMQTPAWEN
jgi:TadE-like protein